MNRLRRLVATARGQTTLKIRSLTIPILLSVLMFGIAPLAGAQASQTEPAPDPEAFRQELNDYLTEWEDAIRAFDEIPGVHQKFVEGGSQPLEQLAKAKESLSILSTEELARMQAIYAKFPGWRELPSTVKALGQRLESTGVAGPQPQFITPDTCSTNPDAEVPSNTDIAATTAAYIALDALMEAFPTDAITVLARLPSIAARAAGQAAVLAVETLKAINDDCTSLDETAVQGIITTATTTITNNDNTNTTAITNNDDTNTTTITNNDDTNTTAITSNDNSNRTTIVNNDNANKDTIVTNLSDAQSAIITSGDANSAAIVSNDNINKNTIVANDNTNTTNVLASVSAAQTAIVNNDNANKGEIITFLQRFQDQNIRLQIEANLAQSENKPVALFVLPASQGGFLELSRGIVADLIAKFQAAGQSIGGAQSLLVQGNTAFAAGQFEVAYGLYSKAYKEITKA